MYEVYGEGEPERSKGPREQEAPPRSKPLGKQEGARLFWWDGSRWSSGPRPSRFGRKEPERKDERRLSYRSPERSKALKGEAPECRELKEALRG